MRLLFAGIVILACWIHDAHAGAYYVDFANGDDSQNGLTPTQCFKHCPGDSNAVSAALRTRPQAGDTLFFRGGVVYHGTISIPWSGKKNKPIMYDGNSNAQWGWDKAIIDGDNKRYNGFFSDAKHLSDIVIRNFEIRNCPANVKASWAGGKGIFLNNCTVCTIINCAVHDIGYSKNDGALVPSGTGIKLVRADFCTVSSCDITCCGESGIAIDGSNNCLIVNNNIHDFITWGIDVSASSRLSFKNVIAQNTVHDLYQFDHGFYKGQGDPPHTDYVFIRKADGFRPSHNIVEKNLFYNNRDFNDFGGTAMTFLSYADSTVIRNNVYSNAHSYSACFFGWTSEGTQFYNNTVYSPKTSAVRLETKGNTDIRNNIFIGASSIITFEDSLDENNLTVNNNMYCMPQDDKCFARATPYQGWNFRAWQARGYDANSRVLPLSADFKFIHENGYPTQCQFMDLRPSLKSPCIGKGIVLNGFSDDKNNIARSSQAWDIGAFQRIDKKSASANGVAPIKETDDDFYGN